MDYADAVRSGEIVACKWVKLAVERHYQDLETGHERGLYFDEDAAWHVIDFCSFCSHFKGEWAGRMFEPEPWELFFLWVLFGWKRADGTRRFRVAMLEIARKNGKTFLAAVVALYLTFADGEPGAEVYSAATKKDQARLCHTDAKQMVNNSPVLGNRFTVYRDNISDPQTMSKLEPLARDSNSLDGLNVHGAIMDELHAWKTRDMWDVIETATGARRQPLLLAVTTAGFNRQSICWEKYEYTKKVLSGVIDDDDFFGIIYELDDLEEWDNEAMWIKANPNLGVSVKPDDLRRMVKTAKESPAAMNAVLRLRMNMWTQAETRWIDVDRWRACATPVDPEQLAGRQCWGGLDLSSSIDITAWVLVFPPIEEDEPYKVLCRFWIPEDNMVERSRKDRVPYDVFVREGLLTATDGNVIDQKFILSQIQEDAKVFDLQEAAFDRWGSTNVSQGLSDEEIQVVEFGQGFASMSAPAKELDTLVRGGKIAHGGNKVLTWMADNVVVKEDPAGNIKPAKDKSVEKIDGIVALIMALDRALHGETPVTSIRDLRFV
jgi:phage terminase large subunit-like protein